MSATVTQNFIHAFSIMPLQPSPESVIEAAAPARAERQILEE